MEKNFLAEATTKISAPLSEVWNALVNPASIKQYMFGTNVISDWKEGSNIVWKGEWKGKAYEDKGKIMQMIPEKKLQYSHFSPLSGQPDKPENYHIVTIELSKVQDHVLVDLMQDNNTSEKEREESEKNWKIMLEGIKKFVEKSEAGR